MTMVKLTGSRVDEDTIEARCAVLRKQLLANASGVGPRRNLKMHMVHELADAKIKESERLRQALKIGKDYQEGGHWRRQEERAKAVAAGEPPVAGDRPPREHRGFEARMDRGKGRDWDAPPPRRKEGDRYRERGRERSY